MKRKKERLLIKGKPLIDENDISLFMVSTLFQLLSAIEAKKYFDIKNTILVLLFYGNNNKDEEQLKKYLNLFDYDKLIILEKNDAKSYINLNIKLIKELQKNRYKYVFTGFFSANLRRIIANLKYKELFLIDDGVYTIYIHNELCNPNFNNQYQKYILPYSEKPRKKILKKIKFFLYNNFRKLYLKLFLLKNDMDNYNLSYFTIFKLTKYSNENVINHNFNYVKELFHSKKKEIDDRVYILGQPLERSINNKTSDYIQWINAIIKKLNKKIVYIPHRAENKEKIYEISKIVNEVLYLEDNFEIFMLKNSKKITHIVSFISTALYTVKIIEPDICIEAYKIPVNDNNHKVYNNVLLTYKIFKEIGIEINTF